MRSGARAGTKGKRPRRRVIGAGQFQELRLSHGWSIERAADLLQVTERTVRNWESGTARCPYAAFKLLRIVAGRKLLGDAFGDAYVVGDVLISNEGHRFPAADLAWWSLLFRQAQAFRDNLADKHGRLPVSAACSLSRHCNAPASSVGSKRSAAVVPKGVKQQSGPKVAPEMGAFHQSAPGTAATDRDAFPVGPGSNTGQKSAQIDRRVPA
ncbi:MAG: hypothetical protein A2579_00565 [Lysobacterales bacterium RIFOXYD1_FULL_69_11]|nr:MAG: hypothetical protein A2190_00670 [Xanthomonadales bacterium RIFOXYA1_FULL_69_10]OHE86377.1 MAG: hypothetical protein A2579_00565 [Xanthomonadales bacterium RIFOXYD1_FULL_69_11]